MKDILYYLLLPTISGAAIGGLVGYWHIPEHEFSKLPIAQEIMEMNKMFESNDYKRLMDPANVIISQGEQNAITVMNSKIINLRDKLNSLPFEIRSLGWLIRDNFEMLSTKSASIQNHLANCQVQGFERG